LLKRVFFQRGLLILGDMQDSFGTYIQSDAQDTSVFSILLQ